MSFGYKIGEFFQELLKKFTHEKDEEGRKMEYLQRRQMRKTNMLMGLYNAELRKTCLTFMPIEIKHERESTNW